jgi:predicted nuclease of predicted toxin-antitoxin system
MIISLPIAEADIRMAEDRYRQRVRFLLDENVSSSVHVILTSLGFDAAHSKRGQTDEELYAAASQERRTILTHDRNFLSNEKFPPNSVPGLVLLHWREFDPQVDLRPILRALALTTALRGDLTGEKLLTGADGNITRVRQEQNGATIVKMPLAMLSSLETQAKVAGTSGSRADLLRLWSGVDVPVATIGANAKGERLERFASALFAHIALVVKSRLLTVNGEIDIILELKLADRFWQDFGSDVMVECKNWAESRPLEEIATFGYKVARTRGVNLAFLVSTNGFTDEALASLRANAHDAKAPLIVPLSGEIISRLLHAEKPIADLLKDEVRMWKFSATGLLSRE